MKTTLSYINRFIIGYIILILIFYIILNSERKLILFEIFVIVILILLKFFKDKFLSIFFEDIEVLLLNEKIVLNSKFNNLNIDININTLRSYSIKYMNKKASKIVFNFIDGKKKSLTFFKYKDSIDSSIVVMKIHKEINNFCKNNNFIIRLIPPFYATKIGKIFSIINLMLFLVFILLIIYSFYIQLPIRNIIASILIIIGFYSSINDRKRKSLSLYNELKNEVSE